MTARTTTRIGMLLGLATALGSFGAPAASAQTPAQVSVPAFPDDALVARGEYLARAADCMPCHTAPGGKPYAGGLGLNTPFGTLYSVNITSDPETGIGSWSYDDFRRALHDGIRKDGAYLYPAMPFDAYTGIVEDDLRALWAYVRRLPAVNQPNPENGLAFPFDIRLGMLAWRELFFRPASFVPTPGRSEEWNRGAYLVEALGHCSDCHSPRNIMGAIKGKAAFTGSEIDGFYAPDIASGALARMWQKDTLVQFLKTGSAPQKTSVFGPMAEVIHDSLSYLTDADLAAMATYLLDSPPPPDAPAPQKGSPLPPMVHARAAKLYVDNCAACHQPQGTGLEGSIPPLAGNPAVIAAEPYNVITVALQGLPAGGRYGAMPSFAGRLSDAQLADLVNYVRTSWGNTATPNATARMVAAWRESVRVPDYGTQAAAAFDCAQVGGAPGNRGPDPKVVAALTAEIAGGNRDVPALVDSYEAAVPDAAPAEVVDALASAYCPVVAASGGETYDKLAELSRFTLQAAADASEPAAAVPFPSVPVIWAVPAGASLVQREPRSLAGPLTCPSPDGKRVPLALLADAGTLIGTPTLPVPGTAGAGWASALAKKDPKARLSDIANALISTYCDVVKGAPGLEEAQQHAFVQAFGQQVIQTLQTTR
ncbi:mono/diheme cytochrome c family protein [Angulomicrobium tetraedrale]|uniref:Mono/diheme cytochrome c family protein n=1 Tax=Ancylobacter tetraedralis TaxID=217068 RepID=A0A839ZFF5_9HYPH|nr:cytochrome c [Ancylobacter tetraedralis]MBB3773509.1 mono/diheme cytochrome c family protein [Ancylobacter tetraedralis]